MLCQIGRSVSSKMWTGISAVILFWLSLSPLAVLSYRASGMSKSAAELLQDPTLTPRNCQTVEDLKKGAAFSYHHISIYIFVALMIIALCVCALQLIIDLRLRCYIPDSILFVLVGALLGFLLKYIDHHKITSISENLTPTLFFLIIIPPIIYDSGYHLNKANFFRNFGSILVFAIVGTIVSSAVTGFGLYFCGKSGISLQLSLRESLAFGALISAIDPVATLAVFSAMDVDKVLYMLVFGESILNDAVAITLMNTASIVPDDSNPGLANGWRLALYAAKAFLIEFVGSAVIGCCLSLLCAVLLKGINFRKFPSLEVALVMLFSYAPYCLADGVELSGIVALLFASITMSNYTHLNLSPVTQITVQQTVRTVALISEMCMFLYLGVAIFSLEHRFIFSLIAWTIFFCFLGRALNVFPLACLLNRFRSRKIPKDTQFVMWFSGMRGAIPFALSLLLDLEEEKHRSLVTTTLVVVLFSIIFLGGSAMPLIALIERVKRVLTPDSHADSDQRHPLFINWRKARETLQNEDDERSEYSTGRFNVNNFHAHFLLPIFTRRFTSREIRESWRAMTNLTDHWYSAVRSADSEDEEREEATLEESDLPQPTKIEPSVVNIGLDMGLSKMPSAVISVQPILNKDMS